VFERERVCECGVHVCGGGCVGSKLYYLQLLELQELNEVLLSCTTNCSACADPSYAFTKAL